MAQKSKKTPIQEEKASDSEFLKRFKQNPFIFGGTIFVLVIVVIAFVLVPAIVPNSQKMPDYTFGYYDNIPIAYVPGNFFAQYIEMAMNYYRNMGDIYNNIFMMQQIWREAYEMAAYRTAVLQEIKKAGYSVPQKTVDKEVAQQFIIDGRFSPAMYERYDNNSRLAMWRRTQEDLALKKYHTDIDGLYKPERAAHFFSNMAALQRSFNFVSFPVSTYPDSEIIAYAEEHGDLFKQTHLSRITVMSSEREARQILKSIKDGSTTFEDAARAHSQDSYSDRGGDIGFRPVHELYQEISGEAERTKVIALAKDELSEVLKLDEGWAIFRAEESLQPADFTDTATLNSVRTYIQTFERGRMEDWALNNAEDFINAVNASNFDYALSLKNLTSRSFGPVPVNYGDVDLFSTLSSASIPELSASSSDENFWKIAFSTDINSPSVPLVQGENVLVLFPTGEEEADEEALESVHSAFENYWLKNNISQTVRSYFLNSSRMEDRFTETFMRYIMPQNSEQ